LGYEVERELLLLQIEESRFFQPEAELGECPGCWRTDLLGGRQHAHPEAHPRQHRSVDRFRGAQGDSVHHQSGYFEGEDPGSQPPLRN